MSGDDVLNSTSHITSPRRQTPETLPFSSDWLTVTALYEAVTVSLQHLHPQRILDIGCGNQPYRFLFPQTATYIGCDVTDVNSAAVVVAHGDKGLPFAAASFDFVLCTQVLEHVAEPATLIAESYRVLDSGGILLLSAPMYWPHHEEPYDYYRFTRHGLHHLLTKAGYVVEKMLQQGGAWRATGQSLALTVERSLPGRTFGIKAASLLGINYVSAWLDRVNYQAQDTTNLVAVARKIV